MDFPDDNYSHHDPSLIYTPSNVPGLGCDSDFFDEAPAGGCSCSDSCSSECACVLRYGSNYCGNRFIGDAMKVVFECNDSCGCRPSSCVNRVVQRGPMPGLEVFETAGKGLGLRTTVAVPQGSFVCEYAGEVVGLEEARRRVRAQGSHTNYVLVVREHCSDGLLVSTAIDPTVVGNIGRYANHSCDPTTYLMPVRSTCMVPHVALFAARPLAPGDEITFDYSGGSDVASSTLSSTPCLCASAKCRKFLPCDLGLM